MSIDSTHPSTASYLTRDVPPGWTYVPCPLCGSRQHTPYLEAGSHYFGSSGSVTLMRCSCGLILTNPQPQGDTLAAFYATPEYYTHAKPSGLRPYLQQIWQRLQMRGSLMHLRLGMESFSNISRFAKRNAPRYFPLRRRQRLLDFGSGDGQWTRLATALGLDAIGVEPDDAAREVAHRSGALAFKTLEEADQAMLGAPYDRILLRHVLEHVPQPRELLEQLAQRLAPTGRILISVPNVLSRQAHTFGPWWLGYELPRHLWHFSLVTLERLVKRAGLHPIYISTVELRNYARISADRLAAQTGQSCNYAPRAINRLEAEGFGTEVVLVAEHHA
ncbi:MAG: class I SAM-dependent methyltransferase [Bacillota bacterium]